MEALGMSAAVEFLDGKIEEQGRDEKVLAHSSQMLYLLTSIERDARNGAQQQEGV